MRRMRAKIMLDNNELYKLIDETIVNLQNNNIPFEKYLSVQSKFYQYSVANMLLVLAQNPNVSVLKDELSWKRESVKISRKAKPINILEPVFDSNGDVIDYNSKKMYDISDTNARNTKKKYDNRTILKAFLHNNIAEINGIDDFENANINAMHETDKNGNNIIFLRRGLDFNDIFKSLANELAEIVISSSSNKQMDDFKRKAVTYLVCKSYNLDIKDLKVDGFPIFFREFSSMKARRELGEIRNAVASINEGIDDYLRSVHRNKNFIR